MKYYLFVGAINLVFLWARPMLMDGRELPMPSIPRINFEKHFSIYCLMYFNQTFNILFTGGGNVSVNMLMYILLICLEFFTNLFGCRLRHFGHEKKHIVKERNHIMNYRKIIDFVHYHIELKE